MSRWAHHLPILAYHRIGRAQDDHVPTVSAEAFAAQIDWLGRRRFRVLDLSEVVPYLDRPEHLPRRSAVITFDDGYEETLTVAQPILKRAGFPSTVFISPLEIGLAGFLTWDQVMTLVADGVTIGSHTMQHAYLPKVPPAQLERELAESKRIIQQRLGRPVDFLSYPVGGYTPEAQAVARAAGYAAACTTNRGTSYAMIDRFALRRVKMTERDRHPLALWIKLSGYYDACRRLKDPG